MSDKKAVKPKPQQNPTPAAPANTGGAGQHRSSEQMPCDTDSQGRPMFQMPEPDEKCDGIWWYGQLPFPDPTARY